jgi:hypothetical protein
MRLVSLLLAATAVTAGVGAGRADQAAPAGRLLRLDGVWTRDNATRSAVKTGIIVFAGERFQSSTPNGVAEFVLYSGRAFPCRARADCQIPNEAPAPQSWWRLLLAKADEPPAVAFTLARGTTPNDAVLLHENGRLDLAPAFESLDAARYTVRLQNLRRDDPPLELVVEWNPRAPQPVSATIGPGLFQLVAVTPERAELGPVVVRIAGTGAYSESRQNLQDALAATRSFNPPLSGMARRQFLLAVLDSQP